MSNCTVDHSLTSLLLKQILLLHCTCFMVCVIEGLNHAHSSWLDDYYFTENPP